MVGQIQAATDLKTQWQPLVGALPAAQQSDEPTPMSRATTPASVGSPLSQSLLQFERARVTYQAQRVEPGRSYTVVATLAYERVALSQLSSAMPQQPQAPSEDAVAAPSVPVSAEDEMPHATDAPDTSPSAPTTADTVLHHVVINATTLTYRRLSVHVTTAPHALPTAPTTPASQAAAPQADDPAIKQLDGDAFASLRARTVDRSSETALTLKLTTQEGDLVELLFQQLDVTSRTRLSGVTDSGAGVRARETTGSSARYVNMQITGDLSDAEKSAIDQVLQQVIDVANQFFHGDMQAAIARLADAQIDTDQLAEFSLKMSMSDSRRMDKFASDDGGLQQWVHRDSGVSQTLEFLADQQQQLIKAARTRFDDRSAVMLVKHLLPAMISPPATTADAAPPAEESNASAAIGTATETTTA